jgi:hypothetical protein
LRFFYYQISYETISLLSCLIVIYGSSTVFMNIFL